MTWCRPLQIYFTVSISWRCQIYHSISRRRHRFITVSISWRHHRFITVSFSRRHHRFITVSISWRRHRFITVSISWRRHRLITVSISWRRHRFITVSISWSPSQTYHSQYFVKTSQIHHSQYFMKTSQIYHSQYFVKTSQTYHSQYFVKTSQICHSISRRRHSQYFVKTSQSVFREDVTDWWQYFVKTSQTYHSQYFAKTSQTYHPSVFQEDVTVSISWRRHRLKTVFREDVRDLTQSVFRAEVAENAPQTSITKSPWSVGVKTNTNCCPQRRQSAWTTHRTHGFPQEVHRSRTPSGALKWVSVSWPLYVSEGFVKASVFAASNQPEIFSSIFVPSCPCFVETLKAGWGKKIKGHG